MNQTAANKTTRKCRLSYRGHLPAGERGFIVAQSFYTENEYLLAVYKSAEFSDSRDMNRDLLSIINQSLINESIAPSAHVWDSVWQQKNG